ncbi:hypothetical protein [Pseudanabaena yagii]|uniref:Uncharacterized protein n=1 Tax=Pseudanabaena yagii GIHE-NHR1 TaxID=2722753 RepID=A0ABX1LWY9_9CYAN|nr:hypothetical protein [Pseudanabaena yagii]NMF59743.1 hypothetical protein [Pseudanabaena yagii GIHE-NHR1]
MSDSLDQGALIVNLLKAIKILNPKDEISRNSIASYLYVPDTRISGHLQELKDYILIKSPTAD